MCTTMQPWPSAACVEHTPEGDQRLQTSPACRPETMLIGITCPVTSITSGLWVNLHQRRFPETAVIQQLFIDVILLISFNPADAAGCQRNHEDTNMMELLKRSKMTGDVAVSRQHLNQQISR